MTPAFSRSMKYLSLLFLSSLLFSCASKGPGEKDLIKQASVEQHCPPSEIRILNKRSANGGASYQLQICGRQMYYYLIDGAFIDEHKYKPATWAAPTTNE